MTGIARILACAWLFASSAFGDTSSSDSAGGCDAAGGRCQARSPPGVVLLQQGDRRSKTSSASASLALKTEPEESAEERSEPAGDGTRWAAAGPTDCMAVGEQGCMMNQSAAQGAALVLTSVGLHCDECLHRRIHCDGEFTCHCMPGIPV
eukprot:CAMPEP_0203998018 /NCGR_PEP_ID=MMETSP0360-20130528/13777_1 /ASSEMBLY_ACC=CAM_ASM_000342 /TAXON_ID=268821 /ORGANISM="Scrippsiella Hangoei, Strain SHTV-5" /LENGTH=149 /DNA_ID=CAMNT_0050939035 /DNA_START=59 /DNA_END=509 /DNA_ORIENTATION=+